MEVLYNIYLKIDTTMAGQFALSKCERGRDGPSNLKNGEIFSYVFGTMHDNFQKIHFIKNCWKLAYTKL